MGMKEQLKKVKENWLLAVVLLIIVAIPLFSGSTSIGFSKSFDSMGMMIEPEMMVASESFRGGGVYYGDDFAPEIEERKITKNAYLNSEVNRGEFYDSQTKLKSFVSATNSFITNENVQKYGEDRKSYYSGTYQIKVETKKYDALIIQLKDLGDVQSFSENLRDITGSYTKTEVELEVEESRLLRYKQMYSEATTVTEKIELNDRIFNQERRVKYLQDSLINKDRQVDYSTVSVTLQEERSEYANIVLVTFSRLIRNLVNSFNGLLSLIFMALPYAVIVLLVWVGVRVVRKRR
ncbi:DUF4349 domain-containing protein [Candidatus Woesearchaeota archaeon]|nr:DUF4349 domain-containing protein [Candidatus Woesearchaeota archaeon]MBT5396752.1 DUF4349 domain-containing protein [Candidatus Woesearchaeota archaeon]MBT5924712.1 DUF4349 domain-containing protein [Candidatus Woesearchaeota archaeon]MBT6367640.1 DUF4349 domain-containing protein [Candidatus Woesearchaeota archaeon]MBT7762960.1 DUF4349 domain-containing protein [Candidatus Woesearchaeota archaeon]